MRGIIVLIATLGLVVSCTRSTVDDDYQEQNGDRMTLRSLITKSSGTTTQYDSLEKRKLIQNDEDNLMMSRIVYKDSIYVLAISRSSAKNVGVSEEMYDKYLEYVSILNSQ